MGIKFMGFLLPRYKVDKTCDALFELAVRKGDRSYGSSNRESDDRGFGGRSSETKIYTLKDQDNTVKATEVIYSECTKYHENNGSRKSLEVSSGGTQLFRAFREGELKTDRYAGHNERYVGQKTTPATPWETRGDIPDKIMQMLT